jgi:hypothetical protein
MSKFVRALVAFGFSASFIAGCASAPPPETLEQASARLSAACPNKYKFPGATGIDAALAVSETARLQRDCECVAQRIVKPTLNDATGQYNGPQIPREDGVLIADTLIQAKLLNKGLEELEGKVSDVTLNHINGCFGK